MLLYEVNLRSLSPQERLKTYKLLDNYSYFATEIIESGVLVGAKVYWESSENFQTSPVYPKGCPCKQVSD